MTTHLEALVYAPADRDSSLRYLAPGEPIVDALLVEVAAESTVDDRMLTIDGETTDSLERAVIVGTEDSDLTRWVEAYRKLRSAVLEQSR